MASATITTSTTEDPVGAQRFRDADQQLWRRCGLEPTERWVAIDAPRTTLRVLEIGAGSPTVFIGGTAGTGAFWAPLIRELGSRRALIVDRPGWGLSPGIDFRGLDFGVTTADMIVRVLDAVGVDRAQLVGASIGGHWAVHTATRFPDRVDRLVLIGGMPHPEVPLPTFIKVLRSPLGALLVRAPAREGMLRSQLAALGHGDALARGDLDDFIAWRLEFQRSTRSMHHERSMVRAITAGDGFRPGVIPDETARSAVAQPVLVVFGTADPTGSVEIWRRYADGFPNGSFVAVERAGHAPFWDDPAGVGSQVRSFLDAGGR
jgi:2-hydroxy-6-oxonona-2,4-dienedioate hydrolase